MKYICLLLLLMVGCTQPVRPTSTIPPTGESPTATPSATATATNTPTVTSSPTITLTPFPSWTPWQVDMDFSTEEVVDFDPHNPHQYCILTYFDLTPRPGFLGVWRRDNGGYMICESLIER